MEFNLPTISKMEMETKKGPTNVVVYCFRRQDVESRKHAINNFVQKFTNSDIIHCELHFVDKSRTVCITSNTPLTFYRGYNGEYGNTDKWICYAVKLKEDQVRRMWQCCKNDKGKKFDRFGLMCFCLRPCMTRVGEKDMLICSKQVANCSIQGGVFERTMDPNVTSPNDIYKQIVSLMESRSLKIKIVKKWPLN